MKTNLYMAYATTDRCWHGTPDFSNFMIIGEMTQKEAQDYLWEMQQECASEPHEELCETCGGSMEIIDDEGNHTECGECDFGYVQEVDWADHVSATTSGYLEIYNPKLHFEVKSARPEHIKYKKDKAIERATWQVKQTTSKLDELLKSTELAIEAVKKAKEVLKGLEA